MYIGRTNNYGYINLNNKKGANNSFENNKNINSIPSQDNGSIDENQRKALKEVEDLNAHLKKSKAALKKARESYDVQLRCAIIARRIISGHKVPRPDYIYLAKNDTDLYQKSIILRQERENPLKHKRISPYEKDKYSDIQRYDMQNIDKEGSVK